MTQAYHWQTPDGVWHVGTHAKVKTYFGEFQWSGWVHGSWCKLISHAHTGELEWVPESKLKPYQSEPIPEPTK